VLDVKSLLFLCSVIINLTRTLHNAAINNKWHVSDLDYKVTQYFGTA